MQNNIWFSGLMFFTVAASAATSTDLIAKLGVVVGEYQLVSKDENCRGGELLLRKTENSTHIQLGARVLVADIEQEETTTTERECTITTKNLVSEGKIISAEHTRCKDKIDFERTITAEFQKTSLKYKIESKGKNVKHPLVKCELELIPASSEPTEEPEESLEQ